MKRIYLVLFPALLSVFLFSGCYDFVNATDRSGSSYQGWTVYDDPSMLELHNPASGEKILYYRDSYELLCSQILDVTEYTFQVSENEDFSTMVLNETVSDHRYEIDPSALTSDTTYYWRVKAGAGDFSDPSTFQVAVPVAGDSMEGGIVFYVDTENWKGLVAAEED
ncbi:MAG: hypothetical protein JW760_14820, partial [Spirochaetales bacterium]|nr:hypothetical protein [Spirochaetales bacterium]